MKAKYYVFDICCLLLFQQVSADLNYRFSKCAFSEGAFHQRCIASPSLENFDVNRTFSLSKCSEKNRLKLKTEQSFFSCNAFQCTMTNRRYRNPRFVEYDILDTILYFNRQQKKAFSHPLAGNRRYSNWRQRAQQQFR